MHHKKNTTLAGWSQNLEVKIVQLWLVSLEGRNIETPTFCFSEVVLGCSFADVNSYLGLRRHLQMAQKFKPFKDQLVIKDLTANLGRPRCFLWLSIFNMAEMVNMYHFWRDLSGDRRQFWGFCWFFLFGSFFFVGGWGEWAVGWFIIWTLQSECRWVWQVVPFVDVLPRGFNEYNQPI